jgi:hypothetical protein
MGNIEINIDSKKDSKTDSKLHSKKDSTPLHVLQHAIIKCPYDIWNIAWIES